jgi:late competence protein required for DNA uptake (superfamily II DNA/RNA helicase)
MLFPTLIKNKKSPPFKKNKTLPTHNPPDKNRMTELIDNNKGMSLDKKEGQLVTCGIFYCRNSTEINGCSSLQTLYRFDSDVLRNRQQKHTAIRW